MANLINNKVEVLRNVCFSKADMSNLYGLDIQFSDKEIEFMIEFKKIYELGTEQLKKFIDKLDSEGSSLDEYTIEYYVDALKSSPLKDYVDQYAAGKKYFIEHPDCMGCNGMFSITNSSSMYYKEEYPLGTSYDLYNKLPDFTKDFISNSIKSSENVFRDNMYCSVVLDNTLPLIDKNPQARMSEEKVPFTANGNYSVKDHTFFENVESASPDIFRKIKSSIGDENYRLFEYRKSNNPCSSSSNISKGTKKTVKRLLTNDKGSVEEIYDNSGEIYDSDERRDSANLKIENPEKDKEYKLNTKSGQIDH